MFFPCNFMKDYLPIARRLSCVLLHFARMAPTRVFCVTSNVRSFQIKLYVIIYCGSVLCNFHRIIFEVVPYFLTAPLLSINKHK